MAAAAVWVLANHFENRPGRIVIDKQTGQEMTLDANHDLFFVPLRYWPAILIVAGVAFMIFE